MVKTKTTLDGFWNLSLFSLNIAKNIIGSFILFMPWTFSKSGLILGNLLLIFIYFICTYSFCLIGYLVLVTGEDTYSLLFKSIGTWMVAIVDVSIIGINTLANAGYIIFISKRIHEMIIHYSGFSFPRIALAPLIGIVLFPFSIIKRLNSLRFLSLASFFGIVFLLLTTIVLAFIGEFPNRPPSPHFDLFPPNAFGIFIALPIFAGNFDCHTNAPYFFLEYYNKTTKKDFKRYIKVVASALLIVLVITCIFTSVSYTSIGRNVSDDVLNDYKQTILIAALSLSMIFSLMVSYVLFLNSLRTSIHCFIFKTILKRDEPFTLWHNLIETGVIVLLTVCASMSTQEIGLFSALVWCIFGSMLVYVYPTVLAIKLNVFEATWLKVVNWCVLVFGVVVSFGLGTALSIRDFF